MRFCFNCGENYSSIRSIRGCEAMNGWKKLVMEGVRDFHLCISSVRLRGQGGAGDFGGGVCIREGITIVSDETTMRGEV